jgi:hypothetical protein
VQAIIPPTLCYSNSAALSPSVFCLIAAPAKVHVYTSPQLPLLWPEWPSPHDCTSSVSDELVLIQLLNLVQSQRLTHTLFFLARPSRVFFFTCRHSLLTQLPPSSTYVTFFFLQNSLSFCRHCHCCNSAIAPCWYSKKN